MTSSEFRSSPDARPAAPALLRASAVSKTYGIGRDEVRVLHDVTLELNRGQTTSLTGVSGSGKTTLLSLLGGLLIADSGSLELDGHVYRSLDDTSLARLRAERIGIVLQTGNLFPFLTALENVELPMQLVRARRTAARARDLLAQVGLVGRDDHRPGRLSGGEAQRVALAMALANDPDVLLADEVTAELDARTADDVMDVMLSAATQRGAGVLYVTHNPQLAAQAQQRLILRDGEVRRA